MKSPNLVRLAISGQLDAGLSSLATFGLQVYTARVFAPELFGAYALVFAAFLTVSRLPAEVVYKPIEVMAVDSPVQLRLSAVRSSLRPGLIVGAVVAPVVVLGGWPALSETEPNTWWLLVGSASLVTVLSPLQDHLRRLLHIADRSPLAVGMASVQFVGVAAGATAAGLIEPVLVPFGALALANASSIACGLAMARRAASGFESLTFSLDARRHLARWLLVTGVATTGLYYAASAVLSALLGFAALGYIEAARVAARPVQVVAQGLVAVVGPRSMAAAARSDRAQMHTWRRRYGLMLAAVAGPYLLLTSFDVAINPMIGLVPIAYVVPGLVLGMVAAYWVQAVNLPMESEILGLRDTRALAAIALATGVLEVAGCFSAPLLLEYTAPLTVGLAAITRMAMYRKRIGHILLAQSRTLEE